MTTNQIMVRKIGEIEFLQRTKDKFFNATNVLEYFNSVSQANKRFKDFWENKGTQEFYLALKKELNLNGDNSAHLDLHQATRGKGGATWMHPYLFVKFCFWLSPEFEVKVIKFVYDNLIEFRLQAGDHYKAMCEVIADRYLEIRGEKADPLVFIEEANRLNMLVFGTPKGKQRNEATEKELQIMNGLQKLNIALIKDRVVKQERVRRLIECKNNFDIMLS